MLTYRIAEGVQCSSDESNDLIGGDRQRICVIDGRVQLIDANDDEGQCAENEENDAHENHARQLPIEKASNESNLPTNDMPDIVVGEQAEQRGDGQGQQADDNAEVNERVEIVEGHVVRCTAEIRTNLVEDQQRNAVECGEETQTRGRTLG